MVIFKISPKCPFQVALIPSADMIGTLSSNAAIQALNVGVLPRTAIRFIDKQQGFSTGTDLLLLRLGDRRF